jgi:hypothetical protein
MTHEIMIQVPTIGATYIPLDESRWAGDKRVLSQREGNREGGRFFFKKSMVVTKGI